MLPKTAGVIRLSQSVLQSDRQAYRNIERPGALHQITRVITINLLQAISVEMNKTKPFFTELKPSICSNTEGDLNHKNQ